MVEDGSSPREPETAEVRVPHSMSDLRLDTVLAETFPEHSRAYFQRCTKLGLVRLNGQPCRQSQTVKTNDLIRITWPDEPEFELRPEEMELDILAEDEDIIVLNKPPGLVVHPAKGNLTGTLVQGLLYHDEERFSELVDATMRPGIVHRLDKDTSGIMVVAKKGSSRRALKRAFADRDVEKTYLALVLGEFGSVTGIMRTQIGRNPRHRMKMAVVEEGGKPAVTRYRVLGVRENVTLVEVRIETGRTHQIRVHFAHMKHPVLGDPLYGGRQNDAPIRLQRQMLHAWKLVFPHPLTGVMREYRAPLPRDFQDVLAQLGFPPIARERFAPETPS